MGSLRRARSAGPPPDATALREAALTYLARYAATATGLSRVLERRVERWARLALATTDGDVVASQSDVARKAVSDVVARLVAAGAVNDAAYAESRARSLVRAGRSRRAVTAQLIAKGIDPASAQSVLPYDELSELAAALVLARKRRIGPFRSGATPDEAGRRRELGVLARAGFPQDIARRALAMDADQAETLVNELRR